MPPKSLYVVSGAANLADIEVPHYHGRSHQILVVDVVVVWKEGGRINATVREI